MRKSKNEDGLGDVEDDTFIHYTWTTMLMSAFFTTFSSSLFQALSTSTIEPITLHSNSSFGIDLHPYDLSREAVANISMIIASGFKFPYPKFTYGNLAFPKLGPSFGPPAGALMHHQWSQLSQQ